MLLGFMVLKTSTGCFSWRQEFGRNLLKEGEGRVAPSWKRGVPLAPRDWPLGVTVTAAKGLGQGINQAARKAQFKATLPKGGAGLAWALKLVLCLPEGHHLSGVAEGAFPKRRGGLWKQAGPAVVAEGGRKPLRGQRFIGKIAINTSGNGLVTCVCGCSTCAYIYIQACRHTQRRFCQAYAKWYR